MHNECVHERPVALLEESGLGGDLLEQQVRCLKELPGSHDPQDPKIATDRPFPSAFDSSGIGDLPLTPNSVAMDVVLQSDEAYLLCTNA